MSWISGFSKAIQDGIELECRPYQAVGDELGISEDEVVHRLRDLVNQGVIRRFAAAIGHRALGILANAMIVWSVPEEDVERVGWIMASFDASLIAMREKDMPIGPIISTPWSIPGPVRAV